MLKDIHPSVPAMRNMIDGTGELNSQFFSRDEKVSESKDHPSIAIFYF